MQRSAVGSTVRDVTRSHCVADLQSAFAYLRRVILTQGDAAPPHTHTRGTMPGNTLMPLGQKAERLLSVFTAQGSATTKSYSAQSVVSARVEKPASGQRE